MAKKKNQGKKHKFKHADPAAVGQGSQSGSVAAEGGVGTRSGQPAKVRRDQSGAAVATRDFSYVGQDLRRIAILASLLIVAEFALWYAFDHTALGNVVYSLVNV